MGNDTAGRRKPQPRVKARLVPLTDERRHLARCGRCGQFLWTVEDGDDGLGPSWLVDHQTMGVRFDPNGRIWRPTCTHLAQRRAACARLLSGTATDRDRAYLRHNGFMRRAHRSGAGDGSAFAHLAGAHVPNDAPRFGATLDLPVAIQCPRCGAENDVEDPVARTD